MNVDEHDIGMVPDIEMHAEMREADEIRPASESAVESAPIQEAMQDWARSQIEEDWNNL